MTATNTPTNTASASITNTMTNTQTQTITITPVPFPYVMNISVYNEAGELVKVIANTTTSQEAQQVQLLVNGNQTNVVSPGSGNALTILLPNVETPDQQKTSGSTFSWDGTNSAGQDVANGAYYIKETTTDPYGHTNIITKPVTVINASQYVQVNIFNTAGELVATVSQAYDGSGPLSLNISNTSGNTNYALPVGQGAPGITIYYTSTEFLPWDGKNSQGDYVASGVYEVQLVVKTSTGSNVIVSKPVTLLNEGSADVLGTVKTLPNPYTGDTTTPLKFTWQPSAGGTIKIKIYNIAGELVRTLVGDLGAAAINWDLKGVGGQTVSSGTYICVVEGADNNGNKKTKIVKLSAIILAGQ
jgi:flagellar hook assembly protein FlgD